MVSQSKAFLALQLSNAQEDTICFKFCKTISSFLAIDALRDETRSSCSFTCSVISISSVFRGLSMICVFCFSSSNFASYLMYSRESIRSYRRCCCDLRNYLTDSSSHFLSSAVITPTSSWIKSMVDPNGPVC